MAEIDDALIGGQHTGGKRKRGAERKAPILVAVENHGKCAGFRDQSRNGIAICQTTSRVRSIRTHSDAPPSPAEISKTQNHVSRLTPSSKAGEWLPWVHIAIMDNFKAFLPGTYHGVPPGYLQEYLNESCCRFNRRTWEAKLPSRLLNTCSSHPQINLSMV